MDEFSIPNLAICLYGDQVVNTDLIKSLCSEKYSNFKITFFEKTNDDKFKALWLVSFDKDSYELEAKEIFNVCLAVDTSNYHLLEFTHIPKNIDNKAYYTTGFYKPEGHYAGASPSIFFAKSLIFSRCAEFYLNEIPVHALPAADLEVKFFYHLKSYNITTECINYENRRLFKRTVAHN